jgi:hypothetical protein
VPRRVNLINKSYSPRCKETHQLKSDRDIIGVEAVLQHTEDDVSTDPLSNALLRLYTVRSQDVPKLKDGYKPKLVFNNKQLEINSRTGTVLVLGRSGTGKTRYLSSRMLSDRDNPLVTNQLFVARSKRLCELMKVYYQADQSSEDTWRDQQVDIMTFDKFIKEIGQAITTKHGLTDKTYSSKKRVDYNFFRDVLFPTIKEKNSPEALIVWTQIRSLPILADLYFAYGR